MPANSGLLLILQVVGTVAFAVSGAMTAISRRLDLLGVLILGVVTAVGGGVLRDLMLGITPPGVFTDPLYLRIAFWSSALVFYLVRRRFIRGAVHMGVYDSALSFSDAVGLGAFTVLGYYRAVRVGFGENLLLCCFLGVTTGVGGGILRDVLTGHTPKVFVKHIYAVASIIGALLYGLLDERMGTQPALMIASVAVVVIRMMARRYGWNLPIAWIEDDAPKGDSAA